MVERIGNIWDWQAEKRWIVIPTNIGWKKDGCNPMGVGVAAKAADMYPDLPLWYGLRCKRYGADTAVAPYYAGNLILFPTKALNEREPWASWRDNSDIVLLTRSTIQLQMLGKILFDRKKCFGEIALPLVGCGAGGLSREDIVPILRAHLDNRFVLLEHYEWF